MCPWLCCARELVTCLASLMENIFKIQRSFYLLLNKLFDEFVNFLRLMLLHEVRGPLHQLQLVVLHPIPRVFGSFHREGHVRRAEDVQRADLDNDSGK